MWVELHGITNYIGHFVEPAIIHIMQGLQDAALHRFQAIGNVRDGAFFDDIRGIVHEVFIKELMQLAIIGETVHKLNQIFHDVFFAFRRVFAHIKREQFGDLAELVDVDLF